jgi:hypothetical protein
VSQRLVRMVTHWRGRMGTRRSGAMGAGARRKWPGGPRGLKCWSGSTVDMGQLAYCSQGQAR